MITLKNENLLINILPERGGRIDDFVDRNTSKNWLWHPETYSAKDAHPLPLGTSFDDHWQGGFEEMFPSDAATTFQGHDLVDHGELWSQAWHVDQSDEQNMVDMSLTCKTLPILVAKRIQLDPVDPSVEIEYRFYNTSWSQVQFMFKLHPALAIEHDDEIIMPPCQIQAVEPGFSTISARREWSEFPFVTNKAGEPQSIHRVPAYNGQDREFVYARGLKHGMCGLKNKRTDTTLTFEFDRKEFPSVWIFQSYGGFNDQYVAMLEPATGMPWDIHEASRLGSTVSVGPHSEKLFTIKLAIRNA